MAQAGYRIPRALHDVGVTFFGDRGRGGQRSWGFIYVFGGIKCRSEC